MDTAARVAYTAARLGITPAQAAALMGSDDNAAERDYALTNQ